MNQEEIMIEKEVMKESSTPLKNSSKKEGGNL